MNTSSGLDRTKMPDCAGFKDIRIPGYKEFTLENGIQVIVLEDKRLPLVSVRFLICSGSIYDSNDKSGTASMLSELILKGTKSRTAMQIAEEIEILGADLTSDCSSDAIVINAKSLTKHFDKVFDITSDTILNPALKEEEIERLREQRLNNLLYYLDHGAYIASKLFLKNVYKSSPYGNSSYGNLDSIKNLSQNDFHTFYKGNFTPDNVIAAFIGDISYEDAYKYANEKFSGWRTKKSSKIKIPEISHYPDKNITIVNKNDFVQSDIYLGHISFPVNNPDYISMLVLNTIIGGTFTSRLNSRLREKHGMTYGISSSFNLKKYSGDFVIKTSVKNEFTSEAVKIILDELTKITEDKVRDDELRNAKNYLQGTFPLQLETSGSIASSLLRLKFFDLQKDFYNTLFSKMNVISTDDIFNTAKKHLNPDKLVIAIAGKASDITKDLEQIGVVSVKNKL